jgi:hypothetical protein
MTEPKLKKRAHRTPHVTSIKTSCDVGSVTILPIPGLWTRIDFNPDPAFWLNRIQHFGSTRIGIRKIIESGSNADPNPQQNFSKQIFCKVFKI